MSKIDQIHKDVFDFLLDKHYQEKKVGKNFFFKIYEGLRLDWQFSQEQGILKSQDKEYIIITFWADLRRKPFIYLKVFENGIIYY